MQKSDNNLFPVKAAKEVLSFIHHVTQSRGSMLYLHKLEFIQKNVPSHNENGSVASHSNRHIRNK